MRSLNLTITFLLILFCVLIAACETETPTTDTKATQTALATRLHGGTRTNPTPRNTPTISAVAPRFTRTPRPTEVVKETRFIAGSASTVNMRGEPSAQAERVGSVPFGTEVDVITQRTADNEVWYQIRYDGKTGWVLGSLTMANRPVANVTVSGSGGLPEPQATEPVNQIPTQAENQPTDAPAIPPTDAPPPPTSVPVVPPPQPPLTCGNCSSMSSCEQAYACLRAGNGGLDRDNDGVPCEDICPGG